MTPASIPTVPAAAPSWNLSASVKYLEPRNDLFNLVCLLKTTTTTRQRCRGPRSRLGMWEAARVTRAPWPNQLFPSRVLQECAVLAQGCGFGTLSSSVWPRGLSDGYHFNLSGHLFTWTLTCRTCSSPSYTSQRCHFLGKLACSCISWVVPELTL